MVNRKRAPQPDPRSNIPDEYKPATWVYTNPYRPPNDDQAVMHRDVLYAAIGRVLTQWEILETVLAAQFQNLIGSKKVSALRAYGSILASGSRIDMLDAVAEIEMEGDVLKTCKTLLQDIRRLAATRNLLAHGVVVSVTEEGWPSDDPRMDTKGPFLLLPAPYNTSKFKIGETGPVYAYSALTIEAIGREVQKAISRAGALTGEQGYRRFWRFHLQ